MPARYPCGREQDLAAYCVNVLGLRKPGKGASAKNGHPEGYDIAIRFCPALNPKASRPSPGSAPQPAAKQNPKNPSPKARRAAM